MSMLYEYVKEYGPDELNIEQCRECIVELMDLISQSGNSKHIIAYNELQNALYKSSIEREELFKAREELDDLKKKYPICYNAAMVDHRRVKELTVRVEALEQENAWLMKELTDNGIVHVEEDIF